MTYSKDARTNSPGLGSPIKAIALVAVIGFVVMAVEAPRLFSSSPGAVEPSNARPAAFLSQDASAVSPPPLASDYFPSRFPAPTGEAEPQPPSF